MIKKLLASSSLAAFILCASLSFSYAMVVEDQEGGYKRAYSSISKTPSVEASFQEVWFPDEVWGIMIENVLESVPWTAYDLLCTSKNLGKITKSTMKDLSRWEHNLTDEILSQWTHITGLTLGDECQITDASFKILTNLTCLSLQRNHTITNEGLKGLTDLSRLDISYNYTITDESLKGLTKLTYLDLTFNGTITDEGLKGLTKLIKLTLYYRVVENDREYLKKSPNITWEGVKNLRMIHPPFRRKLAQDFVNDCRAKSQSFYQKGLWCNDLLLRKLCYLTSIFYLESLHEEFSEQFNENDRQFLDCLERELCVDSEVRPSTHIQAFNPFFSPIGNGFNEFETINTDQQASQDDKEWENFLSL